MFGIIRPVSKGHHMANNSVLYLNDEQFLTRNESGFFVIDKSVSDHFMPVHYHKFDEGKFFGVRDKQMYYEKNRQLKYIVKKDYLKKESANELLYCYIASKINLPTNKIYPGIMTDTSVEQFDEPQPCIVSENFLKPGEKELPLNKMCNSYNNIEKATVWGIKKVLTQYHPQSIISSDITYNLLALSVLDYFLANTDRSRRNISFIKSTNNTSLDDQAQENINNSSAIKFAPAFDNGYILGLKTDIDSDFTKKHELLKRVVAANYSENSYQMLCKVAGINSFGITSIQNHETFLKDLALLTIASPYVQHMVKNISETSFEEAKESVKATHVGYQLPDEHNILDGFLKVKTKRLEVEINKRLNDPILPQITNIIRKINPAFEDMSNNDGDKNLNDMDTNFHLNLSLAIDSPDKEM